MVKFDRKYNIRKRLFSNLNRAFGKSCLTTSFLIVLSVWPSTAVPGEPIDNEVRLVKADIVRKGIFSLSSLANVGLLDVGKDNQVHIRLRNSLSETVHLGKISASCGCVRVKCDVEEIDPGESCLIDVQLRPDRNYHGKLWSQSITFDPKEGNAGARQSSLTIMLRANLAGVFRINSERILFDIPAEQSDTTTLTQEVSLLVTPPVDIDNLKITGSGPFELFDIVLKPKKGLNENGTLTVSVTGKDIPGDGVHCGIVITDTTTKQRRVIAIASVRRPAIRVVPSTISMRRNKENLGWEGYALVIRGKDSVKIEPDSDSSVLQVLIANAVVKGHKPKVDVMEGGLYARRVKISLPDTMVEKLEGELSEAECSWDLLWGKNRSGCSSELTFRER